MIVARDFVVTVTERPLPLFDPVRERVRSGSAMVCRMGADFLAYALLDAVIDGYFPVIEQIGEVLNDLEDEITTRPTQRTLGYLHTVRRTLLAVHRVMYRQRDALGTMVRAEEAPFSAPVRVYLRDAYDHSLQVLDSIESYREMARRPDRRLPLEHEQPPERGDEDPHHRLDHLHPALVHRGRLRHELRAHAGAGVGLGVPGGAGPDGDRRGRAPVLLLAPRLAAAAPTHPRRAGRRARREVS